MRTSKIADNIYVNRRIETIKELDNTVHENNDEIMLK
jgi:hypothetical protein